MHPNQSRLNNITGRKQSLQRLINLVPKAFRLRFNPNRYIIEKFVKSSSRKLPPGSKILDAGAGPCPYKIFFSHCDYESTDFKDKFGSLDFECSLEKIPRKSNSYDHILCTEVLEHVENPQKVLNEFHRILKKEGRLFMTVPQGWMLHQEPHNYFYFTKYGLASLLRDSGFKKFQIIPKGGYFWFLADAVRFNGVLEQYKKFPLLYYPLRIIEYPFTDILIPFILFHLDFLDKERKWTLGYLVEATN
jgi:SAM-dependent methyltransferase